MTKTKSKLCRNDNGPILYSLFNVSCSLIITEIKDKQGVSKIRKTVDRGLYFANVDGEVQ
jgi:hypothetical protein